MASSSYNSFLNPRLKKNENTCRRFESDETTADATRNATLPVFPLTRSDIENVLKIENI